MECDKIKGLLSEYLDKTLQSDLSRNVKEHLLSCKDCSNEFFIMKSIAGELADLERIKAPNYLLNRVNQAVMTRSWFARLFDFIPGSGGFKLPMEFVTLATTALLVFLIFTNIHVDQPENAMMAESGAKKSLSSGETGSSINTAEPVRLDFIPVNRKQSETLNSDNVISVASGQHQDNSSGLMNMINEDTPALNRDNLISGLNEMILGAGGNIISKEYQPGTGYLNAITVKIPSNAYDSFIRKAEEIGRFHPPAPSLSHQSAEPVLLHIKLNQSDD